MHVYNRHALHFNSEFIFLYVCVNKMQIKQKKNLDSGKRFLKKKNYSQSLLRHHSWRICVFFLCYQVKNSMRQISNQQKNTAAAIGMGDLYHPVLERVARQYPENVSFSSSLWFYCSFLWFGDLCFKKSAIETWGTTFICSATSFLVISCRNPSDFWQVACPRWQKPTFTCEAMLSGY